jgi:hypothetical protein
MLLTFFSHASGCSPPSPGCRSAPGGLGRSNPGVRVPMISTLLPWWPTPEICRPSHSLDLDSGFRLTTDEDCQRRLRSCRSATQIEVGAREIGHQQQKEAMELEESPSSVVFLLDKCPCIAQKNIVAIMFVWMYLKNNFWTWFLEHRYYNFWFCACL